MTTILCLCVVMAVVIAWVITYRNTKASYDKSLSEKDAEIQGKTILITEMEGKIAEKDALIKTQGEDLIRKDYEVKNEKNLREKENQLHKDALAQLKESQEQAIKEAKQALALQNAEALRKHEEDLNKKATEAMKTITDGLDKDIKDMKDSFEAQKRAHAEESSSLKTKFEETASHIMQTAKTVGSQADNLANALKGKNKMQGIFGETILENILQAEGLRSGIDYETEYWIRDQYGRRIKNEDTDRTMRPDFVLHFPDNTDVLLDSKVSLTALSDYFAAETDEEREDAATRNLESVKNHVKELARKEYQKYIKGRKTLDYVIMFIPNYGAYQLAKQKDPDLFADAFKKHNVLITTDETLIPFIKLVNSAWVQKEQMENMQNIVDKARIMVERVGKFCKENAKLGKLLNSAIETYNENTARLTTSKQSVLGAANDVVELGVKPSKGDLPTVSSPVEE